MVDPLSIIVGCGIIIFWAWRGTQRRRWIRSRRRKQKDMRRGVRGSRAQTTTAVSILFPTNQQRAACHFVLLYRSVSYVAAGTDCSEKSVIRRVVLLLQKEVCVYD
ncbi:unnamed protein product, partial [Ectocarpus sp. 8 AP-2014]